MLINQINQKRISGGKCRLKYLIYIIGAFILVVLILLVFGAVWLLPDVMRYELEQELSRQTKGPVSVEHIQMSYKGQIDIRGVKLYDKAKHLWLSIEKTMVTLTNWPSLHPGVESVRIDGLDFRLSMKDGRLLLPAVRWNGSSDSRIEDLKLDRLSISGAALTIADANGMETSYKDMTLSVSRRTNGDYKFVLDQLADKDSEALLAGGVVNIQNKNFNLSLQIRHRFTSTEATIVFTALNKPGISAEGRLAANLTVTGILNKPLGFQPKGNIDFNNCVLFFQKRMLVDNLDIAARVDGQTLDVNDFKAIMCNGKVNGNFYVDTGDGKIKDYRGQVRTIDVNYPELMSVLSADTKKAVRGSFSSNYDFSGQRNDPNELRGEGVVFLKNMDISVLPVIPTIFKFIGLSSIEPLKVSDAEAKFKNVGPLVTVESGHVSNLFAAIEFEPGGTVNLQTEQIDGYVVAAPLNKITGVIENLPIIDIFANLKDKLIRLRVKGNWYDPPAKLISKTPIKDIKDSTIGFIQDTAKTGGQFGKGMLDLLGGLLNTNKNKNK